MTTSGNSPFISAVFHDLDLDRNGTLDRYELKQLLQNATGNHDLTTDKNLDILLDRIDTNGDGRIDLTEFTVAFHGSTSLEELLDTSYLHLLFSKIDKDGSDTIEHDEILSLFDNCEDITECDKRHILQCIDKDFDGTITFNEFKEAFRSLDCKSEQDLVQKSYVRLVFDKIDANNNKLLSIDEWREMFIQQNIVLSERELQRLIEVFDHDGNGEIDFYEFQKTFKTIKSIPDLIKKSRLHLIFNSIDTDHSNSLDFDEIKTLFAQENVAINDDNIKFLIDIIDKDGDGCIDFDEFEEAFDEIESIDQLITKWSNLKSIDVGSDLSISAAIYCSSAETSDKKWITCALPLFAGGVGGICSRTVTAPLERVKILQQVGTCKESMVETFREIIYNQGVRGLWRGNMLNCLRVFPFGGLVTFSYGNIIKRMPSTMDEKTTHTMRFAAGVTAGGIATTVTYPMDLLRTQVQASLSSSKITMKDIGFRNMFKGLWPTLFAMSLFVGTQNAFYDYLRINATARDGLGWKPSIELFVGCGMTAGVFAQTVVYPLDVLRRRIQINSESVNRVSISSRSYTLSSNGSLALRANIIPNKTCLALRNIVMKEGVKSMFAGLTPTYLKTIPSVAISVTVRDVLLGRLNHEED